MKKILVTGGAGFIGSHLCDLLIQKNYNVGVIDNFSYGKREFLPKNGNLELYEADIRDQQKVKYVIQSFQPEMIYHLAALHHIPTCEQKPTEALSINIEGTQNILDAAVQIESLKKLILASSGAVYEIVDTLLLEDSTPTMPYDIYSVSKLTCEYLLRLWVKKNNKKGYVARIFNTIGGRETNDHLVPDIISQLKNGKETIELGNLEPKRSYIDVRDTSKGILSIGELDNEKNFEIFNVGREDEFNVKEIASMLGIIYGAPFIIKQNEGRIRKVDRKKQQASIEKLRSNTGWQPVYSVEDGLKYALDFTLTQN
jgi:UDP-glucose 4-epimerase